MSNLTVDILYGNNYSEPLLPKNPIRYVANNIYFTRLMLMMIPFWIFSIWLTLYGLSVIFCKLSNIMYNLCVEKEETLYVQENLNVKKVVKIVLVEYF